MSGYAPGARVHVHHDGIWRPGTLVALTERRRDFYRRQWPLLDFTRAVAVALDGSVRPLADGDVVIIDPDHSERLAPLAAGRHLRAVPS